MFGAPIVSDPERNESSAIIARFLHALNEDRAADAKYLLDEYPDLPHRSMHAAAAVADVQAVAHWLASDMALATQPAADGPQPIIYASHGALQSLCSVGDEARTRTIELLLDAGASPNACVQLDNQPDARIPALYFACVSGNTAAARVLLERGAIPNDGESVYHAAEHNHRDCLALLLAHGADISTRHERCGNTPLYFISGYKETHPLCASATRGMEWLLAHGADPNERSDVARQADGAPGTGETPLHRLVQHGRGVEVLRLLVEHGADINLPRHDGKTPLSLAMRTGNTAAADYLVAIGADATAVTAIDLFLGACLRADVAEVRARVAQQTELLTALTAEDRHVIGYAIETGRDESVSLLLDLGWSLTDESPWGGTPLHWASWYGRPSIARLLLARGAPVDVCDSMYGSSALAWCCHGSTFGRPRNDADYLEVLDLLLDHGAARASSVNRWGEVPESMASTAVAARLRERGFTE